MSSQGKGEVPNARGIRVLNARPFILHNVHVASGKRSPEGCGLCSGLLEKDFGVVTIPVPDSGVRQGDRVDEEKPAASTRRTSSWSELLGGPSVSEEGEV